MAKQILINVSPWDTRVGLLEDSTLVELHIERHADRGIAGNIYKGKVVRVLPGMQAAFADIGLEKAAFLHASDLVWNDPATDENGAEPGAGEAATTEDEIAPLPAGDVTAADLAPVEPSEDADPIAGDTPPPADGGPEDGDEVPPRPKRVFRPIEDRLQKGAELLLQIAKEPMGTKGARVTAHVSLPGRFLVYMPYTRHVGISRRIEDPAERDRLREMIEAERPPEGGFIVRTAAEGATRREIHDDVRFLTRLWRRVQEKANSTSAPALIHHDLDLPMRTLRDLFTADIERLTVDDREEYERVLEWVQALTPRLASRVWLYDGSQPLFDQHGVEAKIQRALERRVWLKSGGYLIFDQTESLTTVDVNTGRYVGKKDQEETVLRTNLEAAKQVVAQLRLRNIGGIIVIDFIDMEKPENRKQVFDALQEAARADKARSNMLRISELGLVQMTRKRTRESLEQLLTTACPHCHESGRVRSAQTLAHDALRLVQREVAGATAVKRVLLRAHPEVATQLLEREQRALRATGERVGHRIVVEPHPEFDRAEFRVLLE